MRKLSLIFPMAGQGARFGYRFKPFLDIQGRSFIEAAFAPFRPWLSRIEKVYFVFTHEQDIAHDVRARLDRMFRDVPYETVVLERATDGPAETLNLCLTTKNIAGPILVCDCDHAVQVDDLMRAATETLVPCALPTWSLAGENLASWSVAAIGEGHRVQAVAEKALPPQSGDFRGVIGCYYFSDGADVRRQIDGASMTYLSEVIAAYLDQGRTVLSVPVQRAHFFGDPARLARVAGLGA